MAGYFDEFGRWVPDPAEQQQLGYAVGGGASAVAAPTQVAKRTIDPKSLITAQNQSLVNSNNQIVNNLNNQMMGVGAAREYADAYDRFAIQEAQGLAGATMGALGQNSALGFQNAQNANSAGQGYINNLNGYYGGQNAQSAANLGSYLGATDPYMREIKAGSYTPWASNPQDIANQQQALSNFAGIQGGSLDYQAALAQASLAPRHQNVSAQLYSSNMGDVRAQTDALANLNQIASGSLSYQSEGARARADQKYINMQEGLFGDLQGVGHGSLNVKSLAQDAVADPEAVKRQMQGIDKLWGLTDPTITAQERFMMELARREQEQGDRAARGAVMADLSSRGFSGSGAQQTDILGAQQLNSQNRTLADLGAQANAQARSTAALGMYVDATGTLRSQTFDEAFKRAAAGDAMAVENANRKLAAMGMSAELATQMRNSSFQEAYARGIAADNAAANNQQTRLAGAGMAANQANAIRDANDRVGMFNTGQQNQMTMFNSSETNRVNMHNSSMQTQTNISNAGFENQARANNQQTRLQGAQGFANQSNAIRLANDSVGMFNTEQSRLQMNFATEQQSREAARISGLAGDRFTATQDNINERTRQGEYLTDTALRENDAAAGRNQWAIGNQSTNIGKGYQVGRDLVGDYAGYGQNSYNRALGQAQTVNSIGSTISGINSTSNRAATEGPRMQMGEDAFNRALKASESGNKSIWEKLGGIASSQANAGDLVGVFDWESLGRL